MHYRVLHRMTAVTDDHRIRLHQPKSKFLARQWRRQRFIMQPLHVSGTVKKGDNQTRRL